MGPTNIVVSTKYLIMHVALQSKTCGMAQADYALSNGDVPSSETAVNFMQLELPLTVPAMARAGSTTLHSAHLTIVDTEEPKSSRVRLHTETRTKPDKHIIRDASF